MTAQTSYDEPNLCFGRTNDAKPEEQQTCIVNGASPGTFRLSWSGESSTMRTRFAGQSFAVQGWRGCLDRNGRRVHACWRRSPGRQWQAKGHVHQGITVTPNERHNLQSTSTCRTRPVRRRPACLR